MFGTLQVVGVLLLLGLLILFFTKFVKRPPLIIIGMCVLLALQGVFSAGLLASIPMPTENITVTALSENNEKSTGKKVVLSSILADGKTYHLPEPSNGAWEIKEKSLVWQGDGENITRSITLGAPIGGGRSLVFLGGPDCGKVKVEYNGSVKEYDLYTVEVTEVHAAFDSTNEAYDNFMKLLRLALFFVVIIAIMALPMLFVCKHKFNKYDYFFTNAFKDVADAFRAYKLESVLCIISIVWTYFAFLYVDLSILTAWSIESFDAFFRGGFQGYEEIRLQNLWEAALVPSFGYSLSETFHGLWNLPVLLLHYLLNTERELTPVILLWSKLFFEICVLLCAYISQKTVYEITKNKKRSMLSFVLVLGTATAFYGVGYSGQDDVFYFVFLLLALYDVVIGKRNRALIWMAITLYQCPLMLIFTALIIVSTSETIKEMLVHLGTNVLSIILSIVFYLNSKSATHDEIYKVFNRGVFPDGNGNISIFAAAFVLIIVVQFSFKYKKIVNKNKNLLYCLCAVSVIFLIFSHRYYIFIIFTIFSLMSVEKETYFKSGILGMCVFEYSLAVFTAPHSNNYFNFIYFNEYYQKIFNSESLPNISLFNYVKLHLPKIADYLPIIHAIVFVGAVWILIVCNPKQKDAPDTELVCPIPTKLMTGSLCLIPIVITGVMTIIGFKMNYVNTGYSRNTTEAIDGKAYVEEYYKGKSADWVQLTFRPITNGVTYPKSQLLNVDIIDAETEEIVGSGSCSANGFKNNTNYTLKIEDVEMEADRWYIFRYYSPNVIEDPNNYMYLLYSNPGTSDPERHYAYVCNTATDRDIGGEIYTI